MLKLNSLSNDVFDSVNCTDNVMAVNGKNISRNEIIATGRLIACEYIGKNISKEYVSRCNSMGIDFGTMQKEHTVAKYMFCAALAEKAVGREAPANFETAKANVAEYAANSTFLKAWNAIDVDVLSPLYAAVFEDNGANGLMEVVRVPFGRTHEIDIKSNDVFVFEDVAWGASNSTTYNYLYGKTLTLTPTPIACAAKIKWYQDVVMGEAGRYYAALMGGMWNKIYAKFIDILVNSISNTANIPTGLKAVSYTSDNWINISTLVAAVNGRSRSDLIAFGQPQSLSHVLPVDGNGAAMVGMQYQLGEQWFREGFLPKAGGVDIMEVNPVIVPGTQNSTIDTLSLGDNIFIAAKGGYKPIYCGIYEGTPMTITATPTQTADLTVDINVTASFDMKPVFASKIGVIQNV